MSKDNLKFEILHDIEYNPYFVMKDSKGITYYFKAIEETYTKVGGGGHSLPSPLSITAWFLTKTEDANGEQLIFEYETDGKEYTISKSQTLSYSEPAMQEDCDYTPAGDIVPKTYAKSPTLGPILSNVISINGKKLKRITSNRHNEKIEFDFNIGETVLTHYYNAK
ncbi:hypothetical protein, partial [Chryseobacterium pennipullorum]